MTGATQREPESSDRALAERSAVDGEPGEVPDGGAAYDPADLPYKYLSLEGCLGNNAVGPVDYWPAPGASYVGWEGDTGRFGVHAIGRLGVVEYGISQARVSRSVWAFSTFDGTTGNGQPHAGAVSAVPRVPFNGDPWTVRPDIECTYVQGEGGAFRAATIHLDHCPTLAEPLRSQCLQAPDRVLCWNYRDQDIDWLGYAVPAAWPMLTAADSAYYYGPGATGSPHDRASALLDQLHAQAGDGLSRCAESADENETTRLQAEATSPEVEGAIEDLRDDLEAEEGGDPGPGEPLAGGAASAVPQCTALVVSTASLCAASTVAAGAVLTSWLTANRKAVKEGVELSYLSTRNIALTVSVASQWAACGSAIFAANSCQASGAVALRPFLLKAFAWSNAIFLGVFGVANVEQTVNAILSR